MSSRLKNVVIFLKIIGELQYLWNKTRYQKKKNAILLYFEKPFK